MSRNKK